MNHVKAEPRKAWARGEACAQIVRGEDKADPDVTESTVGTADQQTQAAWQVSDIRSREDGAEGTRG